METVHLNGETLTLEEVGRVAHSEAKVELAEEASRQVAEARRVVEEKLKGGEPVYGVNTGFGQLCEVRIPTEKVEELQVNLLRSHAAGVGETLDQDSVRAVMVLMANNLAKGHSGIRPETVQALIDMLNHGVHPLIPCKGSVGASGDLAPLSHLSLVLIGEGEAIFKGNKLSGGEALREAGLKPIKLRAKEGLSLVNGCQFTGGLGAMTLLAGEQCCRIADTAGALSFEALLGDIRAFDERIHQARPHPGQAAVASNFRRLLAESPRVKSGERKEKTQDCYSLRCLPQVHGAVRDALSFVRQVLEREINSATDNPLVFAGESEILSGGNFHGEPLALALDFMGLALSELANISERRIERLLNPHLSGLPASLVKECGLHSGLMMAQITAASLVSENKVLAHPASVDSIPTSAGKEDHVSMSSIAANKGRTILDNLQRVLAIELICGAQGLDLRRPLQSSPVLEKVHQLLRSKVEFLSRDRELHKDIEAVVDLIKGDELLDRVESFIGALD
ncbi:MAG: histidine ammonia-lyase [Candidatus Aminicenantes bacterium]|nr:histidine ammonia-lyase [Candidatus Aminicenantes bacterium]